MMFVRKHSTLQLIRESRSKTRIMQFRRKIDSSYPIIYESWVTDDAEWVIQDLQPEDEDEALKILVENLCTEETLLSVQEVLQDSESVIHLCECWRACIAQRMSLGCYEFKYGQKTLVGLSICVVVGTDEDPDVEMRGEKLQNVYNGLKYIEYQVDPYHHMDVDFILLAVGLVVKRWYRGAKLGKKLIAAREPLCRIQGVKGAATICTSTAAQKLSASCGFETLAEVTVGQLADNASLPYPKEDTRVLMYMAKKYSDVQSKRSYFESFFSRKTQKTF